ncbi:hypothetical protein GCM10010112_90740 [Actinoplanes lobatus]|uniref:Uncharacterized protein n=1 Tax=Actinoplanes lobatus TaxID=113568 RepID=A0ABQ4AXV5_9ACTN|nr:hypothetical protein GCM10010112_90740 [Actinoplanes lobatus]GIE45859.1 hypothetical protein Alo02nite_87570 [Actinoplanes lobatus]
MGARRIKRGLGKGNLRGGPAPHRRNQCLDGVLETATDPQQAGLAHTFLLGINGADMSSTRQGFGRSSGSVAERTLCSRPLPGVELATANRARRKAGRIRYRVGRRRRAPSRTGRYARALT